MKGFVEVDDHLRTNIPGVFAIGDVTGKHLLVYTAAYDGNVAATNAVSQTMRRAVYEPLSWYVHI